MHLLIWILAFIALALWSAAAWGVSALLGMDPDWVEGLRPALKGWPGTAWMEIWLPGWKDSGIPRTVPEPSGMSSAHRDRDWFPTASPWLASRRT